MDNFDLFKQFFLNHDGEILFDYKRGDRMMVIQQNGKIIGTIETPSDKYTDTRMEVKGLFARLERQETIELRNMLKFHSPKVLNDWKWYKG